MLLKEDIVDIEKPNGICLLTFAADQSSGFSGFLLFYVDLFLFLHNLK